MRLIAIDYGDVRTGIATCNQFESIASPYGTIEERNAERLADKIKKIVEEMGSEEIVLGYPKNMNGTVGPRAEKCEAFAELLKEKIGLNVVLWDERTTTMEAHGYLNSTNTRGKKRKAVIDTVSAVLILQGYMAYRKNKNLNG